jgi:hypothetical protein
MTHPTRLRLTVQDGLHHSAEGGQIMGMSGGSVRCEPMFSKLLLLRNGTPCQQPDLDIVVQSLGDANERAKRQVRSR